jgi:UDP-GlcNAc:undecaprenyl-phosphate GlcNAc-1-phosphate transferase
VGLVADPERQRFYALTDAGRPVIGGIAGGLGAILAATGGVWSLGAGDLVYSADEMRAITLALLGTVVVLGAEAVRRDRRRKDDYGAWPIVVAVALLAAASGVAFAEVTVPGLGVLRLGWANVLLTTLWVVIVVALFELLDTVPRAPSVAWILVAGGLWLASLSRGESLVPTLAAALLGAGLAVLPWTAGRRVVLLGKTGTKVIGYLLAALTIVARRKMEAALVIGIPLLVVAGYVGYVLVSQVARGMEPRARRPPA